MSSVVNAWTGELGTGSMLTFPSNQLAVVVQTALRLKGTLWGHGSSEPVDRTAVALHAGQAKPSIPFGVPDLGVFYVYGSF